jgi:hypothetical protein
VTGGTARPRASLHGGRHVRVAELEGDQVDDGTYVVTNDGTFVVSKEFPDVTFNYTIEGDTISFDPVIPDCSPECFEAPWSVSVAYPGETWTRATS